MINVGPVGHYANYILTPSNEGRVPDIGTGFILQHLGNFYWTNPGQGTVFKAGESQTLPSRSLEYYNRYKYAYTIMSGGHGYYEEKQSGERGPKMKGSE